MVRSLHGQLITMCLISPKDLAQLVLQPSRSRGTIFTTLYRYVLRAGKRSQNLGMWIPAYVQDGKCQSIPSSRIYSNRSRNRAECSFTFRSIKFHNSRKNHVSLLISPAQRLPEIIEALIETVENPEYPVSILFLTARCDQTQWDD